jgi:hypothetical protein
MKKIASYFLVPATKKNWRKMKVNHRLIWLQVLQDFYKLLVLSQMKIWLVKSPILKNIMQITHVLVFILDHFLQVATFW